MKQIRDQFMLFTMAIASYYQHLCILVLLAISTTCSLGHDLCPKPSVPLFIFGDSLFDAGNNNYINTTTGFQANYWPYGETLRFPTGRFSDGRLIPDFIAEYAGLPLIPPYLQPGNHFFTYGANFASVGSGAVNETAAGFVIDLKMQLSNFKNVEKQLMEKFGDIEAKQLLSNAVYLFSTGSNDYVTSFISNSGIFHSYTQAEYVEMVIGNLTDVIKVLYKKGGRKFGLVNLGPLGCLPFAKVANYGECVQGITTLLKLHNTALPKVLQKLEKQLKGFTYSIFDFYTATSESMNNPSKYGFKIGKTACCGSGRFRGIASCGGKRGIKEYGLCANVSEYVLFDAVHPTERENQRVAKLFWNGNTKIVRPYNLKALFEHQQE